MAEQDDGFLERWSRRKAAAGERRSRHPDEAPAPGPAAAVTDGAEEAGASDEAEIVRQLPDIESLDEQSDFTAFLKDGVPEALRERALRKLWRLNPVFANLDGLNDYDEDFTDAATVVKGLKTLYQVGKGMVLEETPPAGPPSDAQVAEAPAAPAQESEGDADASGADGEGPARGDAPALASDGGAAPAALEPAAAPTADPESREPAPERGSGRSAARRRWGDFAG